jgi:large subunit ribosomal protein L3
MIFYGFKIGQGQDYDQNGRRWPVTFVRVEPMTGVNNRQVVFGHKKNLNKPFSGMIKNLPFDSAQDETEKIFPKYLKELKIEGLESGKKINFSDFFTVGDKIKVSGTSKGKGFAGAVKRHNFKGGPKTHGQSDRQRAPGAIGSTTTPGRVYKGKRMAGHMGNETKTVTNLSVFSFKPEENTLVVRGLIPGSNGGLVKITKN